MYNRNILIEQTDPEVWAAIQAENARQEHHIELIASENYASPAVMQAQGSQLTNKYAEGYPGKRYYGGCEFVDVAEQLAIDRIKQIFGCLRTLIAASCHSGYFLQRRAGFFQRSRLLACSFSQRLAARRIPSQPPSLCAKALFLRGS